MWDLPGPGREPVSPALAGGFLTTAPPGKSHDWHLMLPVGWNTYTRPLHVDWASSQHDGIRLLTRQLRAPKANAPREPSRSYCLLWACLDVTYHCFKSQACSDSGGRNIDPTSQWGMSQTHCKSIWGGRYCCSNLWKVSSATVLETFPLGWRPWLNFLWIFSRPITQYLEKNTCVTIFTGWLTGLWWRQPHDYYGLRQLGLNSIFWWTNHSYICVIQISFKYHKSPVKEVLVA